MTKAEVFDSSGRMSGLNPILEARGLADDRCYY
jgi:hypothetical protein